MMERRRSVRTPTSMGVQVYAYGMLVAHGTTVDMSEHGMLLRILEDLSGGELQAGKHLDVLLENPAAEPADNWRPVQVVRCDASGLGAQFLNHPCFQA